MKFQDTGYILKQVQQQLHMVMEDALRPLSLNLSQYNVLKSLAASPHTTGAQLARKAFVTPQTMHTILVTMERKKLITRTFASGDKKSIATAITRKGASALKDAESVLAGVFAKGDGTLSASEQEKLGQLLRKLLAGLKDLPSAQQ